MRQLVIFTDSSRNPVIVYNRLDYSGYGTVLYAWAKWPSSSHYRSELQGWFWRQNTSVALRTSSDEDVTTAVTLGYVSLFDVDFSILYMLYLMVYLNPGASVDRTTRFTLFELHDIGQQELLMSDMKTM